ncbi:MAG: hypothetical protein KF899_01180 [Parvibaculum sp.]|nr:hypothetical protein [Nitrospira sp.]MBX3491551.1 hypothetical protein [Parvibaculum sp.]
MIAKAERIEEFIRRMMCAPAASSHDEAFALIENTLNQVEDAMTDIPFDPNPFPIDGRLYPPRPDSRRDVSGRSDVVRYRSRGHNTWIGENGAIHIRDLKNKVFLDKPGMNGKRVENV